MSEGGFSIPGRLGEWRIELQLGNKEDLAAIGRQKQADAGGDKVSDEAKTASVTNNKSAPAHDTL